MVGYVSDEVFEDDAHGSYWHLGSSEGVLEHESGREGRLLVDASDLG